MEQEILNSYSILNRLNVSRETYFDFELFITMIMEKNAGYTNRVVGQTDEIQNAMRINPSSLGVDNFEGIYLNTAHIQLALREYLGLSSSSFTKKYPLSGIESINIFS